METPSLTVLTRQQLDLAENASSGRSSQTVYGGEGHLLRQTLIALAVGRMLAEHENPGEGPFMSCMGAFGSVRATRPGTARPEIS